MITLFCLLYLPMIWYGIGKAKMKASVLQDNEHSDKERKSD